VYIFWAGLCPVASGEGHDVLYILLLYLIVGLFSAVDPLRVHPFRHRFIFYFLDCILW
jgi:hypothetical protein